MLPSNSTDGRLNPGSPGFEALIDLLASDGTDDGPPSHTPATSSLRNTGGKLDYNLIHSFFSGQQPVEPETHGEQTLEKPSEYSGLDRTPQNIPREEPAAMHETIHDTTAPLNPSPPADIRQSPARSETMSGASSPTTVAPLPLSPVLLGGEQMTADPPHKPNHKDIPAEPDRHVAKVEPLPIQQLTAVLAQANDEIAGLRRRIDELKIAVGDSNPAVTSVKASGIALARPPTPYHAVKILPSEALPNTNSAFASPTISAPSLHSAVMSMTEVEAKEALSHLLTALSISPTSLRHGQTESSATATVATSLPVQHQQSVESIQRAIDFVGFVDEIVWRRSFDDRLAAMLPQTDGLTTGLSPPLSEENVTALKARLTLWERAVRTQR